MTETVTVTHHKTKPEYQWEMVVPEGPTVLLRQDKLQSALAVLGRPELREELEALPNGGSRSMTLELEDVDLVALEQLGVKTVMQN